MKKLVIFDCDGVLVDSEIIANRIDAEALTAIGYTITTEESIRRFTGLNAKTVSQIILNESGLNIPLEYLSSQQPILLEAFEMELLSLMKPILEFTKEMKTNRCVASSSPRNRVIRCLELTEQLMFFNDQSIFTSQQVLKGKPAPDLFLFAASQMECLPEDCIVVEDSAAGIEAAIAAGMKVIGFLGGSHARFDWYQERIEKYNVPIAKNCDELLSILKSLLICSYQEEKQNTLYEVQEKI
jgi:HAD superfamily hydrolase (TIGR01509 family)